MNYGLPYLGSKSKIAKQIIDFLPPAEHFYDLFAGGCAITHAALLSGKYKYVHANDITDSVLLFERAFNGEYRNEKRWIGREDFFALKDTDPYVRYCWSFGNNGKNYMYSKEIEPHKKALHYAIMFNDFSLITLADFRHEIQRQLAGLTDTKERRIKTRQTIVSFFAERYGCVKKGSHIYGNVSQIWNFIEGNKNNRLQSLEDLQSLQRLEMLESLGRLERLQSLQSLERLTITQKDYREIEILPNSVIYCDPPYKGTATYLQQFDHEAFYNWAEKQKNIYISEYQMP